jgi:hypothetical protein
VGQAGVVRWFGGGVELGRRGGLRGPVGGRASLAPARMGRSSKEGEKEQLGRPRAR